MEPWTGVFDEALVRLDGEEDLAPRVIAMAGRRRWAEVRGRGSGEREKMEGCSVFGSSLVLFKVQMTGLLEIWNLYR